jgi:hypothetical protein
MAFLLIPQMLQSSNPPTITTTPTITTQKSQSSNDYPIIEPPRYPSQSYYGHAYPPSFGNEPTLGGQRGVLQHDENDNYKLPLYGDREYPGSRNYQYTVLDHTRHRNRIELETKYDTITDGEKITVPGYTGTFTVHLYDNQGPRYYPNIIY